MARAELAEGGVTRDPLSSACRAPRGSASNQTFHSFVELGARTLLERAIDGVVRGLGFKHVVAGAQRRVQLERLAHRRHDALRTQQQRVGSEGDHRGVGWGAVGWGLGVERRYMTKPLK